MARKDQVQLYDCIACGAKCCRHLALEIDKPTCKRDYDNIRWYLMHENVNVFVDREGKWTLEFLTKCQNLLGNDTCIRYTDRPIICRDYPEPGDNCEYVGGDSPYKLFFSNVKEFEQYLDKRGIDWRWRKIVSKTIG